MNAARVPLSTCILLFATLSFLAARPACAGDPHKLHSDFLWFVSGHGVNVSQVADGGDSPFVIAQFAAMEDVPQAAAAREKIGALRDAVARLQTPGEHVLPAGYSPGIANTDLAAASLFAKLGGNLDAGAIDWVVGIDLKTGTERTLVRAARDGGLLLDPGTAETIATGFLPLYSGGAGQVSIHFKSDSRYRPPIDRNALVPFGFQKEGPLDPHQGMETMPATFLSRAIPPL